MWWNWRNAFEESSYCRWLVVMSAMQRNRQGMKTNGNKCDNCRSMCIDDCPQCGAPQCCPRCCDEATAEIPVKPVKKIEIDTGRIYHASDDLIEAHKKGETVFICNGVILQPCFVGRGGDTFHIKFNWA